MALTPYCENSEVRAALGVSDTELEDATLNLPIYSIGLKMGLEKISRSLPASFFAISQVAETERTDKQIRLYDSVRLYSIYFVAKQAGGALGLISIKSLTDNKANFSRFSDAPYRDVLDNIEEALADARAALLDALTEMGDTPVVTTPFTGLVVVNRSYDPVTGEGG